MATSMTKEFHQFPHRPLAFISLALGFLIIWTAVLAGILLSRTVKDQSVADETLDVFHIHEHIGKISFSLGHEMVSTVDWLLVDNPEPKKETISVTWKMTDNIIKTVRTHGVPTHWIESTENSGGLLDTMEAKLKRFRQTLNPYTTPHSVFQFFSDLNDLMMKKSFRHHELMQSLPLPSAAYTLFVKGMFQRFGEITLGTVFVKSDIPLNKTEFIELRTGSEQLMNTAFGFLPRAHSRWKELKEQDPQTKLILAAVAQHVIMNKDLKSGFDQEKKGLIAPYLDGVKEQIATLLLTKEVLNTAVGTWVEKSYKKAKSSLAFHLSISVVALLAVLVCLVVTGCTFSHLGKLQREGKLTLYEGDTYYATSDKTHILPESPNYLKPQCYL